MKNLFFGLSLLLASTAFAQYTYTESGANGNTTVKGQYSADPGIIAGDSKQTIATKLAGVQKVGSWKYWAENGTLIAEEQYTMSGIRTLGFAPESGRRGRIPEFLLRKLISQLEPARFILRMARKQKKAESTPTWFTLEHGKAGTITVK
jgi:hypothetical protein